MAFAKKLLAAPKCLEYVNQNTLGDIKPRRQMPALQGLELGDPPTVTGTILTRFMMIRGDTRIRMATSLCVRTLIGIGLLLPMSAAWGQTVTVGPNLGTWRVGEVQLALTATGGNGTYSWALVSGTLPTGLALRTDVPSFFPAGTAAGLIGVATTPGTYSFTLAVTSGGSPVPQAFTMKITGFEVKDTYNLPDAFVGSAYSYTITPLNNAGAVTFTPTGGVPAGMTLSGTGVLSGTPSTAGSYSITFSLNDTADTIYGRVGLKVSAVQITTPGLLPNVTVGNSYSVSIAASGGTPPYTFSSGGLPQGLSLNSSTGLLSGTVIGGQGRRTIPFTVTDNNNVSYTKNMALDILHPTVTAGYLQPYGNFDDCTIGISCSRGVSIWNGGTEPFNFAVTGLPPGMSFRTGSGITSPSIWAGDLELWGTPTAIGTYNVQITVTDVNGVSTIETFPLKVSVLFMDGADYLPAGTRGVAYSKTLRVLGGTGPYSVILLPASNMPAGLSLTGMVVSGTPGENGFFNGELGFSDSASNSLQITSYFSINPTSNVNINNGPNLGTITVNSSYTNQLSACCVATVWNQIGGALPAGMTLSAGGLLSGTPTTSGTYTFTVQALSSTDPAEFGVRVFTVVVTPLYYMDCCTLPYGNVGTAYGQDLAQALVGATGTATFTLVPGNYLPPGLTLNGAGLISGTPTEPGQFQFTIRASDTAGHILVRTGTLYIYPAGITPPVSITLGSNLGTWTIGEVQDALNASGGNGTYTWSMVSGSLPPGLSIRTDVPSFFPAGTGAGLIGIATTPGTYSFTLSVTSNGTMTSQAFTMKITALTEKDVYTVPNGFIGVPYSYTLTPLNAAGAVTWTATSSLPPGLTFSSNGIISGTPTQSGFWNVNFQFTDGVDTVYRSFGISVFAIHFTTSGLLPNAMQGAAYNTGIAALGGTGSFTFTGGGLPNGLSMNSAGMIAGTPNTGPGRYGFNVTVTDTNNVSYASTFSIDVIGRPPSLPSLDPINVNVIYKNATIGFSYARIVSVFSGGTAPFTWSATGLPPGMSIRPWNQAERVITPDDAEIWGTPTATGTFNVEVTVTDANGATASLAFPFSVSALGVDGSDYLPNGTLGTSYSKTVRVLGGTGPYTVSLFNRLFQPLPAGLSLSGMVVSGTPLENGGFTPVLQFQDSVGNILQNPEGFTISGGTGSTVSVNQTFNLGTITEGSGYSFQLSACCTNSGQFTWSQVSGTLPPGLNISSGGLLSGTATTPGTFDFILKAADSSNPGNFGERQFQLVVTPLAYTTTTTLPYGNVGSPYNSGSLLTSVTGASGTVGITLEAGSYLPPGLAMSNGSISGTPTASGRFSFNLFFTDAANDTLLRGFTVYIYSRGGSPALQLMTLAPCRVIDTRNANGPLGGPYIAGGTTRSIPIPSSPCGVPANAVAYSLNITVVPRTGTLGYLSVWPTGQPQPLVSTLNSLDGSVLANAAIVPAGINGFIDAYATNDTELIVDINGYFVPPATGTLQFYPLTPCRILDTRNPTGTFGGPSITGGNNRSFPIPSSGCGVPSGAAAYSLNLTVVPQGSLGYLTTWPTGEPQPVVSTLNSLDGTVLANAAIVPAGTNGAVSFFASNTTDLIVDINGYFAPPAVGGLNFYTAAPCRLVDTRNPDGILGGPILAGGTERTFPLPQGSCGLPGDAAAYSLNMTVVPSGFLGYLATWPAGGSQPVVSTLNAYKGQVVANAAIVPAGTSGAINVYVTNPTHAIIDTNGYFGQ